MNFMKEAFNEALISFNNKEIPVGCVIVYNNKIIARGHNNRQNNYDILGHAEINAIKAAEQELKDWRLNKCDLYVTLKPCSMCMEIIKASRINNIYYLLEKPENKIEYSKTNISLFDDSDLKDNYSKIINSFFNLNCNR